MTSSEAINEIAAACAKAQVALKPAIKDATNPAFRSKYADMAAYLDAAKVYAAQGVAIFQDAQTSELGVAITTRLVHSSGQWLECGPFVVPVTKKDAHGIGSATTYAKRYALAAALGIASDDDDGNAAAKGDSNGSSVVAEAAPKTAPVAIPKGFSEWLTDLESVADEGETALREAWRSSPAELRTFLTGTNPAKWDAIKLRATKAKVSA